MERRIASPEIKNDHIAIGLMNKLEELENEIGLEDGIIYYYFPLFRDSNEKLHRANLILITRSHGLFIFNISNDISKADIELGLLDSFIFAKLIKSSVLRKSRREINIPITSIIYLSQEEQYNATGIESTVVYSLKNIEEALVSSKLDVPLSQEQWTELISLIEGGKGIVRPKEREIFDLNSKASIIAKIETQIANFDNEQPLRLYLL